MIRKRKGRAMMEATEATIMTKEEGEFEYVLIYGTLV